MPTIALRLDPQTMANPDLDIRHVLPNLLSERSGGVLLDDGYDYVGDSPYLLIFLEASDIKQGLNHVLDVIQTCWVLDNDLRDSIVVAVNHEYRYEVVYPAEYRGDFPV